MRKLPMLSPAKTSQREYVNTKCFIAARVNSPVKRLFTISCSQRHKPLDRGYIYLFFLLKDVFKTTAFFLLFPLLKPGVVSVFLTSEDKLESK